VNIYLETPSKNYCLCKNVYIDHILGNVVSHKELQSLNAMDYTLHSKDFEKLKAKNEKDVIEIILKNRKSIIEFDKKEIENAKEKIIFFQEFKDKKDDYQLEFKNVLNDLYKIGGFKNEILNYLNDYNLQTDFYISHVSDKIIKESRVDEIKTLRSNLESLMEVIYDINDIKTISEQYFNNKHKGAKIENLIMKLKQINILINEVYIVIYKLKEMNDSYLFYDKTVEIKDFINYFIKSIDNFSNVQIAENQIETHNKIIEICNDNITINQTKINLIYNRLNENHCCPVCYLLFNEMKQNSKIYITHTCCNNKICEDCIDSWYELNKNSCIFCNTESISKETLIYFENNDANKCDTMIEKDMKDTENYNFEVFEHDKHAFLKNIIMKLSEEDKKIIIFSDYDTIFKYIEDICNENNVSYVDLDKGNIKDIDKSVHEYKFGNAKILLSNSTLFGCGMNFENSTDIIFVHKMNTDIEKQVIGRAQRMGRKSRLNIIYLQYENECEYVKQRYVYDNFYEQETKDAKLDGYYTAQQYYNLIESIQNLQFSELENSVVPINISTNEVDQLNNFETNIEDIMKIPDVPVDVNLDELIASLF
jgi:hypothetical protein